MGLKEMNTTAWFDDRTEAALFATEILKLLLQDDTNTTSAWTTTIIQGKSEAFYVSIATA